MYYSQRIFMEDDTLPTDEVDELFEQLLQIKPPPSLIQKILTSVARLPFPPQPPPVWDELDTEDGPVVHKDNLPPS